MRIWRIRKSVPNRLRNSRFATPIWDDFGQSGEGFLPNRGLKGEGGSGEAGASGAPERMCAPATPEQGPEPKRSRARHQENGNRYPVAEAAKAARHRSYPIPASGLR
jgi:hypothetical protein